MPDELIKARIAEWTDIANAPQDVKWLAEQAARIASLEAERDGAVAQAQVALAKYPHDVSCLRYVTGKDACTCWRSVFESPADALAGVKAEAAATALEEMVERFDTNDDMDQLRPDDLLEFAAAIRSEVK